MGTNLSEFIVESNRILKLDGLLKIAEVKSRVADEKQFVNAICSAGFKLVSKVYIWG
jgi:ribosomal RNA-processing protein 8